MPKNIKERLNIVEPKFVDNVKDFFVNKKKLWKIVMIFSIAFFIIALTVLIWHTASFSKKEELQLSKKKEQPKEEPIFTGSTPCDGCMRRQIDGIYVKADEADLPPIAIMIDNHFDARPALGIDKANLVYEAEVEGRFTRYMAVFATNERVENIGPVRSARPYFVDWADELGALYCHCGGSPQALAEIASKGIFDLNEFYNAPYYWRSSDRAAPHNIFTSSEKLKGLLAEEEVLEGDFTAWKFKDDEVPVIIPYPEIVIKFKPEAFVVKWEYDKDKNAYLRYLAGERHLTGDEQEIWAKNLLIQYIPAKVLDEKLRLRMDTTGWGKAVICLDGTCTNGEWKKASSGDRTIFIYQDGTEVKFNAGPTWIEVVRPDVEIDF